MHRICSELLLVSAWPCERIFIIIILGHTQPSGASSCFSALLSHSPHTNFFHFAFDLFRGRLTISLLMCNIYRSSRFIFSVGCCTVAFAFSLLALFTSSSIIFGQSFTTYNLLTIIDFARSQKACIILYFSFYSNCTWISHFTFSQLHICCVFRDHFCVRLSFAVFLWLCRATVCRRLTSRLTQKKLERPRAREVNAKEKAKKSKSRLQARRTNSLFASHSQFRIHSLIN